MGKDENQMPRLNSTQKKIHDRKWKTKVLTGAATIGQWPGRLVMLWFEDTDCQMIARTKYIFINKYDSYVHTLIFEKLYKIILLVWITINISKDSNKTHYKSMVQFGTLLNPEPQESGSFWYPGLGIGLDRVPS